MYKNYWLTTKHIDMQEDKFRYSREELNEFEVLLTEKLEKAAKDLDHLKKSIRKSESGHDTNFSGFKSLEDGAIVQEQEHLNQLAARTQKYIKQLENALVRIKNGTYGICIDTGKLIPKARLRAVPHTQHSIEAKLNKL